MSDVVMYSTPWCPYCIRARHLLKSKGVPFSDKDVSGNRELRQEMQQRSGQTSVPQIWIGETHVGGCDELHALERAGRLDAMLSM